MVEFDSEVNGIELYYNLSATPSELVRAQSGTDSSPPQFKLQQKKFANIKSKDTLDLKKKDSAETLNIKSSILVSKGDGSDEKVSIKKAKSVHFADSLGKPLKSVKTLFDYEDDIDMSLLKISLRVNARRSFPVNIFMNKDHTLGDINNSKGKCLNFKLPLPEAELTTRVRKDSVCLESLIFRDSSIFGTVTVKNICFEKELTIIYTLDDWKTQDHVGTNYIPGSSTGSTDVFSFEIVFQNKDGIKVSVKFAICYKTAENTFWDSNSGKNYEVEYYNLGSDKKKINSNGGFIIAPQTNFLDW